MGLPYEQFVTAHQQDRRTSPPMRAESIDGQYITVLWEDQGGEPFASNKDEAGARPRRSDVPCLK